MEKKPKVMVVDDEPEIVENLRNFFSMKGYEVVGAFNGEEALSILEKERADLILLDIMMPGIKGTEVARIVKKKYPDIKLIMLTGFPEEGQRLTRDSIADDLFIKPVGVSELYMKLLEIFGKDDKALGEIKPKQGIKARVLLIKSKLLFIEPSKKAFEFLSDHFQELANRGEEYSMDVAQSTEESMQKLSSCKPDMVVINMDFVKQVDKDFIRQIYESENRPKEIIIYNLTEKTMDNKAELQKLTKAVQAFCLKNGLLEVKWIDI